MDALSNLGTYGILAALLALIVTILVFVFVIPRRLDGRLGSGFLQFLHDLFHFKQLFLEKIVKFLYAFTTFLTVFGGLIGIVYGIVIGIRTEVWSILLISLGVTVLGPIVVRVLYEVMIMGVLLVQNVIDINRKLRDEPRDRRSEPHATAAEEQRFAYEPARPARPQTPHRQSHQPPQRQGAPGNPQVPRAVFCQRCGTKFSATLPVCPVCGRANA